MLHYLTVYLTHVWAYSSMVEQGTHNPLVAGSNPAGPTTLIQFFGQAGNEGR